jgi:hypothetical protein
MVSQSANAICFSENILKSTKLLILEFSSEINVVNDKNETSTCTTLFGAKMSTFRYIRGTYVDFVENQKRCGYISNNNMTNGFIYMESNSSDRASLELSYYNTGYDFGSYNKINQTLLFDPRDQLWYNQTLTRQNGMRWSAPYIHPLTKRATITLSTPFQWQSSDTDSHVGVIALDLQVGKMMALVQADCKNEFIIDKASNILISSSMASESSDGEVRSAVDRQNDSQCITVLTSLFPCNDRF